MTDPEDRLRIGQLERDVALLKRTVDFLLKELKLQYRDAPETGYLAEVRALAAQNRALEAVRLYRDSTGVSLAEAKAFVDGLGKSAR